MSVPKSKQTESRMQFIETARKLYEYTIRKSIQFPKRYTFYNGQEIYRLAQSGFRHVKAANVIFPTNQHEAQMRRDHLTLANCDYDFLLTEIDVAKSVFGLETKVVLPWVDMIIEEQRLISSLKSSDKKRFKDLP